MMLVLDTNVISEVMKAKPDPQVIAWLDSQPSSSVWTTRVSVFEIGFGLRTLPDGERKRVLQDAFKVMLTEDMDDHILDFDRAAANRAGEISAKLHGLDRSVEVRDVQIAGIVSVRHAILATRNSKYFQDIDISLVNPWDINCR